MKNNLKIIILFCVIILLTGCQDLVKYTKSPEDIVYFNLNDDKSNNLEKNKQNGGEGESGVPIEVSQNGFLEKYTIELGRTDPDIKSMKTYTFDLPKDVVFEIQGVDAQSSILEFKKDELIIFRMINYDYVLDENLIDMMYPNWDNYSLAGNHTNILILENENYEQDLYIFTDSLRISGNLVFK